MEMSEQKHLAQQNDESAVRLENWEVCNCNAHVYRFRHLAGNVYNHPHFPNGEKIHTSELITVNGNIGVCKSRTYHLVNPKGN